MATGLRDTALLPLSTEYVRVRGLAQPAVLVTMVAQSGLLAQQDSLTPALTVAVTVALSLLGSVVFVAGLGWGLAGAAATTVACQYVGAIALLYSLSVRGKVGASFGG
jgi:Na+-driven multidrug efflux pump